MYLFCVDRRSGTDEVVEFSLENDVPRWQQTFWAATGERRDTHHMNSILPVNGQLVGVSRGRNRSRSLGTIENPADVGDESGSAALYGFDVRRPITEEHLTAIDLSRYGPEIYDVLLVDTGSAWHLHSSLGA